MPYCFTLEGNYATGLRINTLEPRYDREEGKQVLREDHPVQDTSSAFYNRSERKIPIYGSEVYRDVGQAFLISILDLHAINPLSRLVSSASEKQKNALTRIRKELKKEYFKPPAKPAKGKKGCPAAKASALQSMPMTKRGKT